MSDYPWLIVPLCVLGAVIIWCLIWCLIALVGGWATLARHFRATDTAQGQRFYFQSGELNGSQYKGCLILGVTPAGLTLSVLFLFRPGHAPLLIPWSCLGPFRTEKQFWLASYTTVITAGKDRVSLTLFDRGVVEAIQTHVNLQTL